MILHGDCLEELQKLDADSIDFVCTDPPYGYSFMGMDWDKDVPNVEIWRECLRVLKPGAFCCVMSAPRSDVQCAMISRFQAAGFRLDFTPVYWTYATGFPKAGNMSKLIDKRLGVEQEGTGIVRTDGSDSGEIVPASGRGRQLQTVFEQTKATSPQAKTLDGSYAGFQPKPAVEVIIVAMKPLSEKTFVDQAMKNGKGISWLDEGRIPVIAGDEGSPTDNDFGAHVRAAATQHAPGRFPANLLVSDDALNDGTIRSSRNGTPSEAPNGNTWGGTFQTNSGSSGHTNTGSYSRYFDLDAWSAKTLPFLIVPKAAKSEKNKGLEHMPDTVTAILRLRSKNGERGGVGADGSSTDRTVVTKNHHPTVKPIKLVSYLIALFSRPGDIVLDPFVGSGTTCIAAEMLGRASVGIEREAEYVEIAEARLEHTRYQRSLLSEAGHEAAADEV